MTALTDTQRLILNEAAHRPRGLVLPLPDRLKGGAADKVVEALLARGLVKKAEAEVGEPTLGDGVTLILTTLGFDAIAVGTDEVRASNAEAPVDPDAATEDPPAADGDRPKLRAGTKQAALIAMLQTSNGATVSEIAEALGWQPHTVRGAIAGALKKRLGLTVTSESEEDRGRVYRIHN